MPMTTDTLPIPDYQTFSDAVAALSLPKSGSEIHGVICAYLSAGKIQKAEAYLQALAGHQHQIQNKNALLVLFSVFSVSQQQIVDLDFKFQLLIPGDEASLADRAQGFSEWCDGFTQGLLLSGIEAENYQDEEAHNAALHLAEFAKLDYEGLAVDEADEKAFMEISEYARMAVLRIHSDLKEQGLIQANREKTH